MLESKWLGYFQRRNECEPWETLVKTVGLFTEAGNAVDLGCGTGNDTKYLVDHGWKVIAVDAEKIAENFLFPKVSKDQVTFVVSTYEKFEFPHEVQIVNASYALPFCHPDSFDEVMLRITKAISKGGRFCGHFFGPNDSWAKDKSMTFHTKEQVENYFKGFTIEYYKEEEYDGASGSGSKHWHLHHIIAKKI